MSGASRRAVLAGIVGGAAAGAVPGSATGRAAGRAARPSALPFAFRRTPYRIRTLSAAELPYATTAAGPLRGAETYDAHGVVMRSVDGVSYDHPVLQAQWIITRLASFGHNRDPAYLRGAELHAARLLHNAVRARGALYLPYPFDWPLHFDRADMMVAPWYSAMAQGQALSAFTRLHAVTGAARYRAAAEGLFASFRNLRARTGPWTVDVDRAGYLWFEEYAKWPGPDRAYNGHVYAVYGLLDHHRATGSAEAGALLQGGLTAAYAYQRRLRQPGWASRYCLGHSRYAYDSYHAIHVQQLYQLYTITGELAFARAADAFRADFPADLLPGSGWVSAGRHEVLSLDREGAVAARGTVALPRGAVFPVTKRAAARGHLGVWLRIAAPPFQGRWVRERPGVAFRRGVAEWLPFAPPRLVRFRRGTYTGFRYGADGTVRARRSGTLSADSAAHARGRCLVDGAPHVLVADGLWAGYYVPLTPGVAVV
ncbi:MAG TPA: D-glucuronyl C5-epimerase family protein [Pilimelia sp.]|nr:D-glucuronyl C5-epimerase family protein [Pilimelia sp.]